MADTPVTPPEAPTLESLTAENAALKDQIRVKDQTLAAYADALGKCRTLITSQAQENFQRIQEILEVAEMRVAKAQAKPSA